MKKASTVVKEMEALASKKTKTTTKKAANPNRDKWVEEAENKLDAAITAAASKGERQLVYPLNALVTGAENLNEAAEMCGIFAEVLTKCEYKHVIKPDGVFVISW